MKKYGKYGRKVGWIVKWYGNMEERQVEKWKIYRKYGGKVSWIVKRYGQYGRKGSWIVKRY